MKMCRTALCVLISSVSLTALCELAQPTHSVVFFPSSSDESWEGVARVINHSARDGEISIVAIDAAGNRTDPVTLMTQSRQTVQFTTDDLEHGNELKGLSGRTGVGEGSWRLEFASDLQIEVLTYIRTDDGFMTSLHDTVQKLETTPAEAEEEPDPESIPDLEDETEPPSVSQYEIPLFNPANELAQQSRLHIVNPSESDAEVSVSGQDSTGDTPGDPVVVHVGSGSALSLTASELESRGMGDGIGVWRLFIESDQSLLIANLMESPSGHLTNLSSINDTKRIPYFPANSSPYGPAFVQVFNRSTEPGTVSITSHDDAGRAFEPTEFSIEPRETKRFYSKELEFGTASGEMLDGTGTGEGDWQLEFISDLDIEVLAFVETDDRFITAIHDAAPGSPYRSRVPMFSRTDDGKASSTLRLVNVSDLPADIRIQGIDDHGVWSSYVRILLPARAVRKFTLQELETGAESLTGMFSDGIDAASADETATEGESEPEPIAETQAYQLIVRSDQPVVAMSLMESPTGYLTNLSTEPMNEIGTAFDHEQVFAQLKEDTFVAEEPYWDRYSNYRRRYEFGKYAGFQDLLLKYDYHLPTGRGLTVLQAEGTHTPDDIGTVHHLVNYIDSDNHSGYVASILTENSTYPLTYTQHTTFSVDLDSFHTIDTAELRKFAEDQIDTDLYPTVTYDDIPIAPAKLLNVSNTNGGSYSLIVREFDKFIEENDIVACTAFSSLQSGNWTTSGMSYNSIVVGQRYSPENAWEGAKISDHGSPRYKPDIVSRSSLSHATSFSSPQVCSAAAMLLERVSLDSTLSNAYNSIAIKAILMGGATRFNYRASVPWSDVSVVPLLFEYGEWTRTSEELPLSAKYGAGSLNVLTSYDILDSGEFDGNLTESVPPQGWDFARDLVPDDVLLYQFEITDASRFSAALVWHRYIDEERNSYLPDYELEILDSEGARVAFSNSTTSNVEFVETSLLPGSYTMSVAVTSDGDSPDPLTYGLAWTTKHICPEVDQIRIDEDADSWVLAWDPPETSQCHKFRLEVRTSEDESAEAETDLFLDVNAFSYSQPNDGSTRYFRVFAYPTDGEVAYYFPSSATQIVGNP